MLHLREPLAIAISKMNSRLDVGPRFHQNDHCRVQQWSSHWRANSAVQVGEADKNILAREGAKAATYMSTGSIILHLLLPIYNKLVNNLEGRA